MLKNITKIWNTVTTILVILIIALAFLLVGARIFGLQVYTVLSGSMEPSYQTGSLIYVKDAKPSDLKAGDVITFMLNEDTIATHRIVEVIPDPENPAVLRYRTKGDANNSEDGGLVHYKNVIGKPIFTIPKLGYLANFIQKPPGSYLAISAGAILLLLIFLPDLFSSEDASKKPRGDQDASSQSK